MMSSVWPTAFVAAFYLVLVYGFLPAYMKNRKPYNLTTTIRIYNIFQITICSWIIYWVSSQSKKVVNKKHSLLSDGYIWVGPRRIQHSLSTHRLFKQHAGPQPVKSFPLDILLENDGTLGNSIFHPKEKIQPGY